MVEILTETSARARRSPRRGARLDAHVREIVRLALRPGDRLPVLARARREPRLRPAEGGRRLRRPGALRPLRGRVAARRAGAPLGAARRSPAGRPTSSRPAARPACRSRGSTSRTSRSTTSSFSDALPDEGFPRGADWLMLGPTGPRRLRLAVEHLAQHRGGICFHVDLDPRWVNKLIKQGQPARARGVQGPRHRAGADGAARPRASVPVHHAEAARGALRAGLARQVRHPRHLLRRHRDERAVPPLRPRGAGAGDRVRADLRQHARWASPAPKPFDPGRHRGATRSPTTRRRRARSSSSSTPTTRSGRWSTARPGG